MVTGKKSPEVRFAGFTQDWETGTLKELTDIYDGTHQTPSYKKKGVMFLSVENIKNLKSNKFISEQDFENDFKVFPEKGDILMTRIGDVGTPNIVEEEAKIAYYVTLALLKKKELNPYFLKEVILSKNVQQEIWHRTLHIAFPRKINKNEIEKVRISYPKSQDEQKKIGYIFRNINRLIENHQTQVTKLKNLKKAMLTKMFPQNGESVPELRFKGFDGEWEEKKLVEIVELGSSKRVHRADYVEFGVPFFRGTEISKLGSASIIEDLLYISEEYYEKLKSNFGVPHIGDILITAVGTIGNAFLINSNKKFYFKDGNLIWLKNIKINSEYLITFLKNGIGRTRVLESAIGSNQKALTMEKLGNINVDFPSLDEQKKIGDYFKSLNTLIENHNEQLKKLNNVKKACLSKLFVT